MCVRSTYYVAIARMEHMQILFVNSKIRIYLLLHVLGKDFQSMHNIATTKGLSSRNCKIVKYISFRMIK